jgi:NTP pyrophosphatase (non-canonical NTP hydrolase)
MNLEELETAILEWGAMKGILPDPVPGAQWSKTQEEVDELYDAIREEDREEAMDAIGDIFVTLVMQTQAWDCTMEDCVQKAYDTISKRTGKMVNGVFVKDN